MPGLGGCWAAGVKREGQAQGVWGLQWCRPPTGREPWGGEGWEGQLEESVS